MVADGQQNCIAQELVALDVRRYADLVQDLRHGEFVAVLGHDLRAYRVAGRFQDAAYQYIFIKGLDEEEREPAVQQFLLDLLALKRAGDEERGAAAARVLSLVTLLDRDCIQVRHKSIQKHGLRVDRQQCIQRLGAVFLTDGHGNSLSFQRTSASIGHLRVSVGHHKFDLFHRHISSILSELRVPLRVNFAQALLTLEILPCFSTIRNRVWSIFS